MLLNIEISKINNNLMKLEGKEERYNGKAEVEVDGRGLFGHAVLVWVARRRKPVVVRNKHLSYEKISN
jgi:hypothetical protein